MYIDQFLLVRPREAQRKVLTAQQHRCQPQESNAAVTNSLAERLEQLNEPYQPTDIIFPSREICGVKRRFSKTWFKNYPWLHYDR